MGIAILRLSGRVRKNTVEGEGKIATFFGVRQQGCAGPKPFDHNPSFSESHFFIKQTLLCSSRFAVWLKREHGTAIFPSPRRPRNCRRGAKPYMPLSRVCDGKVRRSIDPRGRKPAEVFGGEGRQNCGIFARGICAVCGGVSLNGH